MGDFGKVMEDQFLSLLSYVAEQERKKNRQRQAEGIEVAKNEGVKFGRPKKQIDRQLYPSVRPMEIRCDYGHSRYEVIGNEV